MRVSLQNLTTMPRSTKTSPLPVSQQSEGDNLNRKNVLHAARRIAPVGLLGAALGAIFPVAIPAAGAMALTTEGVGLFVGLTAGVFLSFKHFL